MPKAKTPQRAALKRSAGSAGQARYLAVALETGGPRLFVDALENVVRSKGADHMAKVAGVSRSELEQAFSADGRRKAAALLGMVEMIGRRLTLKT
jgi:probable addiction module antidote protein